MRRLQWVIRRRATSLQMHLDLYRMLRSKADEQRRVRLQSRQRRWNADMGVCRLQWIRETSAGCIGKLPELMAAVDPRRGRGTGATFGAWSSKPGKLMNAKAAVRQANDRQSASKAPWARG